MKYFYLYFGNNSIYYLYTILLFTSKARVFIFLGIRTKRNIEETVQEH